MSKHFKNYFRFEATAHFTVSCLGILFTVFLLAGCHNEEKPGDDAKKDTASTTQSTPSTEHDHDDDGGLDPGPQVDWLQKWDTVKLDASINDSLKIQLAKKIIRSHVRGWLVEYNDSVRESQSGAIANYVVNKFEFVELTRSPWSFKVRAFLKPPARRPNHEGPGGHIIPPPPPPPGKG